MRIILATLGVWVAAQWFDLADKVPTGRGTVFVLSFAVGAFPLIIWQLVANILKRLPGAFLAGGVLSDGRRGKNTRHLLTGLFRQSVFGRLAGYEDVNDADRLAHDPIVSLLQPARWAASRPHGWAAKPTSPLWPISPVLGSTGCPSVSRRPLSCSTWSSVSETHGAQEGTAYNGHFACMCYHLLFVFNQFGDLERCALRPGNVHSADGWKDGA
jgi:Transposase DDE domain group 1